MSTFILNAKSDKENFRTNFVCDRRFVYGWQSTKIYEENKC